jgi:hypothetical protein
LAVTLWEPSRDKEIRLGTRPFAIDWKNGGSVQAEFGWAELQRELRVRTAIDRERRRAKDDQLFA